MKHLDQLIDRFAKYGEPLVFSIICLLIVLSIVSNIEPVRLFLQPYIIPVSIVLVVLATIGFVLNSRKIDLDSAKRKADFEAMLARHDAMLAKKEKK